MQHDYFNNALQNLTKKIQEKVLNIVAAGKGITPLEKSDFYSDLKKKSVSEDVYENANP